MQSPLIVCETMSFSTKSLPQYASMSLIMFLAAASSFPGSLSAIWSANVIALASYWPWSMRIGVLVVLPSTSMVVVQLNFTGKPAGSEYLMVTAPVSSFRESVNVTGMCSSDEMPAEAKPPLTLTPMALWESAK